MANYITKTTRYEGKKYYVYGKTEAEALEKLGALKAALKRGEVGVSTNMTVKSWADEWLATYIRPLDMTDKSYAMYEQKLYGYITPRLGAMRLKDIKDTHLQRILNEQQGMSFSHTSKLRLTMKKMFGQAFDSRLIAFDPSRTLVMPKTTKGTHRSLTAHERDILHKVVETHRCGLWILTLLGTGIRPGESAPLLWKDVDLNKNVLHINKAIESGTHNIKDPKTAAGTRDVPIPNWLSPKLETASKGKSPFDFVFPQTDGATMMTQTCISNNWRSFKRQMDLAMGARVYRSQIVESVIAEDLALYCLRHTYCTDLQAAGVPINIAKYLMGHSDISVTANIYTHADEATVQIAASYINQKKAKEIAQG